MTEQTTIEDVAPVSDYSDGTQHLYINSRAPSMRVRLTMPDGTDFNTRFENSRLVLNGPQAKVLDALLESGAGIAQYVRKVDREAAEEAVRQHIKERGESAHKGPFSTAARDKMRSKTIDASSHQLAESSPNNPEGLQQFKDELAHNDFEVTERVDNANAAETAQESGEDANVGTEQPVQTNTEQSAKLKLGGNASRF